MDFRDLFPYPFREGQKDILEAVYDTIRSRGHLVMQSATGTGKTVATLTPALYYAVKNGKKVLYLTRTNSQQRQVVLEFREIMKRMRELGGLDMGEKEGGEGVDEIAEVVGEVGEDVEILPPGDGEVNRISGVELPLEEGWIYAVPLQGRGNLCPLIEDDPEALSGTPEELSKLCSHLKRNTLKAARGEGGKNLRICPYYMNLRSLSRRDVEEILVKKAPLTEEFSRMARERGFCPYEALKMAVPEATVVIAPYIFFFSPFIRKRLLDWMGAAEEDIIVLLDEAHNLEDYARDIATISLSSGTLNLAVKEMEREGDSLLSEGITTSTLLSALQDALEDLAQQYLVEEDGVIPPHSLIEFLMEQLRTTSPTLYRAVAELERIGEAVEEKKKKRGKLPRSYLGAVARFLLLWGEIDFTKYVPLIVRRKGGILAVEASCLDPAVVTDALNNFHSTIHFSGTLKPLKQYADSIGLEGNVMMRDFPSPFPPENLFICYEKGLSTRFEDLQRDPTVLNRLAGRVSEYLQAFEERNKIVFFPSFNVMEEVLARMDTGEGRTIRERREMSQRELMDAVERFRRGRGNTLFSVMGGRVSEGMDFPAKDLELILICGIPYPKPTSKNKAQITYYDRRFGRGWDYAVHTPAARKMLQAIGRLIRSEEDRGAAVILDERAEAFKREIPAMGYCKDGIESVRKFFEG